MASTKRAWKLQEFVAHGSNVNCLALGHKSGRVMVTGGEDKKVNMWAVGKPNCIMSLSGHTSPVEAVRFGNAEEMVVAGSMSGALKIWDLEAAKIVRTLTGHKSSIRSLEFHPYGDFVASGSLDTNIKLWDIRRKGCIFTYKGHTNCVNCLRFSPDGRWIASAGEDSTLKIWDLTAGKLIADFKHHSGPIHTVEFNPNEFLLASGSSDRTVKFWDLEQFQLISSTDGDCSPITTILFHPEGSCLYSGANDMIKVYGWEPTRSFDSIPMAWGKVADIAFAQNQLIGAAFSQSNVSTFVIDIQRVQPIGGVPPTAPNQNNEPLPSPPKTASGRRTFNERPPTASSKPAVPKEEVAPSVEDGGDDPGDDAQSVADIKDPDDYKSIFQPRHTLAHGDRQVAAPFQQPVDSPTAPAPTPVPAPVSRPPPSQPSKQPTTPQSNRQQDGELNMNDFLPKKAVPSVPSPKTANDMSEAEAVSSIMRGHDSMMAVMQSRQRNLQVVRALWTGGNIKTAVDSALGMNDQAVIVDLLGVLVQKPPMWSLDLCATLMPSISELLSSKYENYVTIGCIATKMILKNFATVIKSNIVAPPSAGVDISREERYNKCKLCYRLLMDARSTLDHSKTTQGKNLTHFRELQLLFGQLD